MRPQQSPEGSKVIDCPLVGLARPYRLRKSVYTVEANQTTQYISRIVSIDFGDLR